MAGFKVRVRATAVVMGLAVGVAPGLAQAAGKGAQVTIQLFQFKPAVVEIKAGTEIRWTNNDAIEHTVTSGTPESRDGRFNARLTGKGETFAFTFTEPGSYPYFCNRHQHMRGEIRVR